MIKLNDDLLQELGLAGLPLEEKKRLLAHIYETLEMRVGMKLAQQMTDEQLDEFEQFIKANDEAGALNWLETKFPHYKDVVSAEFEALKAEIRQVAPQILSASTNPGHQQPVMGPQSQQPMPYGAQPAPTQPMPAVNPLPQPAQQWQQPQQYPPQAPAQPQWQQQPQPAQYAPQQPVNPTQPQMPADYGYGAPQQASPGGTMSPQQQMPPQQAQMPQPTPLNAQQQPQQHGVPQQPAQPFPGQPQQSQSATPWDDQNSQVQQPPQAA